MRIQRKTAVGFIEDFLGQIAECDRTAFTSVLACVNNIDPGLGDVGTTANYVVLTDFQTWVCTFSMLLGRLELLSVLELRTLQFWRK